MSAAMGRPKLPEDEARKGYPIRLSKKERNAYQAAADAEGIELADWIRKTLTDAAKTTICNTESGASRT